MGGLGCQGRGLAARVSDIMKRVRFRHLIDGRVHETDLLIIPLSEWDGSLLVEDGWSLDFGRKRVLALRLPDSLTGGRQATAPESGWS